MHDSAEVTSKGLMSFVDDVLSASGIMQNRYFTTLESAEMSLDTFRRSQQQFYFAVDYFSRPMSALMMRLPSGDQRLGILENIVEEHGNFRVDSFHEATFRQFLKLIGGDAQRPDIDTMGPAVHAFNATIMSACLNEDVRTGIACLGIIEYAFADISALLAEAVVKRGFLCDSKLVHYKLHEEIDKQHAATFFDLIDADWQADQGHVPNHSGASLGSLRL